MEIFTLLTGIAYIILEIRQKNFMWVVGVITSIAAMYMFYTQQLYASLALNAYYFFMSFWGLYQWSRDSRRLVAQAQATAKSATGTTTQAQATTGTPTKSTSIHLNRLTLKTVLACILFFFAGLALLRFALDRLDDPMSGLDAAVAVLSAVATYMLSRSYIEQWFLWIVADLLTTILCLTQGMYWMTALYALYTISAVYGYFHWHRHGTYLDPASAAPSAGPTHPRDPNLR